jgi:hypothetical protein
MLWLLFQDTAFILGCQDGFGPKVPINSSVLDQEKKCPPTDMTPYTLLVFQQKPGNACLIV